MNIDAKILVLSEKSWMPSDSKLIVFSDFT
jgi:hypothetical protein